MNKTINAIILAFIAFSFLSLNQWTGKHKDQFIAKVSYATADLTLNDQLVLSLDLTFPKEYHPDLPTIKKNLSTTRSFTLFPFFIQSIKDGPVQNGGNGSLKQHLEFVLDPIMTGSHTLTFFNIPFLPNEEGTLQKVEIISDVFSFNISAPKINQNYRGTPAPLMDFSTPYPIEMSSENRKQFIDNPELLKKLESANETILRNRSIPWAGIVCLFLSFLFIWASRQPYAKPKAPSAAKAKTTFSKEKAIEQIADWEQKVDSHNLPGAEEFLKLTDILKEGLKEESLFPGKSFTTEEAIEYTLHLSSVPPTKKEKIKEMYLLSDQVKFAHRLLSAEDWKKTLQLAKELVQNHGDI